MQRIHWLVIAILCLASVLIRGDVPFSSLLTKRDYESESQQEEPALSSSLTSEDEWESFNEWRCSPTTAVELTCTEIDYGGWRKSPTIVVAFKEGRREYDLDPTLDWDCDVTLKEWQRLLENSTEVCLFGAFLQTLDENDSLWVLSQLKSEGGYWKEGDHEPYQYTPKSGDSDREENSN